MCMYLSWIAVAVLAPLTFFVFLGYMEQSVRIYLGLR
jgi:hypothetical protein